MFDVLKRFRHERLAGIANSAVQDPFTQNQFIPAVTNIEIGCLFSQQDYHLTVAFSRRLVISQTVSKNRPLRKL